MLNSANQQEKKKFDRFISIQEVKAHYGLDTLPVMKIKGKDNSHYHAVVVGENIIALVQDQIDTTKPMSFGVYKDDNNVERMRLVNVKNNSTLAFNI